MNIEVKDIDEMIFVATLPRSGSSMICGILEACGAFGGKTIGKVQANPRGIFENRGLNQMLLKPIFDEIEVKSSRGLLMLHNANGFPADLFSNFKMDMTFGMNRQGYDGGTAYFKNGIFTFLFDGINKEFPNARWILPIREHSGIEFSNNRIHPNRPEQKTKKEIGDYMDMYDYIERVAGDRAIKIKSDDIVAGDYSQIKSFIDSTNLEWNSDAVDEWVDPSIWGDAEGREPFLVRGVDPANTQQPTRRRMARN